jgi:hypothetical protein
MDRLWRILCVLLIPTLCVAAESLDGVEKVATEWVKTRAETVRLETEWTSQRELLASTVAALEAHARQVEEKRDNLKAKTATDRGEIEEAQARNQASADALKAMDVRLRDLDARLDRLRPALPPRLSGGLEMAYRSLAKSDLTQGERMQLTMTVLDRCAEFNRTVSYGEEVLTLDGEAGPKSFEVIYWGLSHGYALDREAGEAWLGSPAKDGWSWEAQPQAAGHVAELIAIYNGKTDPRFVQVPAKLGHLPAQPSGPAGSP